MKTVTRLKMYVESVLCGGDPKRGTSFENITLKAVYEENGVNKEWSQWTPSGSLEFQVNNPKVLGNIKPGQEMYVDLIPEDMRLTDA